jgi:branched-chain amino acid transport system substrate-binding protein
MILARAIRAGGYNREKVRASIERIKRFVGTAVIFSVSPADHNGLDIESCVMLTVQDGKFALLEKEGLTTET